MWHSAEQIREFSPSLVSIQDGSQVEALKELIKGVDRQPEIVVGDAGMVEVASHPDTQVGFLTLCVMDFPRRFQGGGRWSNADSHPAQANLGVFQPCTGFVRESDGGGHWYG